MTNWVFLLGRVYVQLLTYEDVTVCISLTLSSRTHTNVQLKTRSHTCVHVCISYFPIILTEKNDLEHKAPPHHRDRVSLTLTLTLWVGVMVGVGVGLRLVYFVLEHEVFLGRRGLDRVTTYCVMIGPRPS